MGVIGCIVSELERRLRFTIMNGRGPAQDEKKAREPKRAGLIFLLNLRGG
jgi:hypothetical protein